MKLATLVLLAMLTCGAAGNDIIKGNTYGAPNAPLMIEVFSDFECPACKSFHDNEVPQLMRDFVLPGKAYLIYRYFPLAMHPHGRPAAEFVCAAAQIGKYQEVAEALFARQQQWSGDGKVEQAVNNVLTASQQQKVRSLLKSPAVQDEINHDMEEGKSVPVQGTPSLLITYRLRRTPVNGVGVLNYTLVKALLDDLLKK
jgi:protein-disulfide isomerase